MDDGARSGRALTTTWTQREITHLSFDATGHGAAATRAHRDVPNLGQDVLPGAVLARLVLRGEAPPHAAACGGSRAEYA